MQKVVSQLSDTIDSYITYTRQLPPSAFSLSKTKNWGPKEVLIHLVYWQEQYGLIIHTLLNNEKPEYFKGSFTEANADSVKKNKDESVTELLRRLKKAQGVIEKECQDPNAKNLKFSFKEGGMTRPLPEALIKIEQHFQSHKRQLIRRGYKILQ